MSVRRVAVLAGVVAAIVLAIGLWWLPDIVRHAAVARVQAMTGRNATIDRVDLNVLNGRFSVHGFALADRDGVSHFASLPRIDGQLHWPSLFVGHVRLRDLRVQEPSVRVVRLTEREYNLSDLQRGAGDTAKAFDITVERFQIVRGRAILHDVAQAEPRTWTSDDITIEAYDVSTLHADGRATGRSVTAGADTSFEIRRLRLHPISLEGTVNVAGLDLTLAQVYVPAGSPVRLEQGRLNATVTIALDAAGGIRADASGRAHDVVLARAADGRVVARVPEMTTRLAGFGVRDADLRVGRLAVEGRIEVRDPTARAERFHPSNVRASVIDLTWPATTSGRLDFHATIPGGGTAVLAGTVRAPPAASDLRLKIAGVDLATWGQFVPGSLELRGMVYADLRMNEALGPGLVSTIDGTLGVARVVAADGQEEIGRVERATASGLQVRWPEHLAIGRLELIGPRTTLSREADGTLRLPFVRPGAHAPPVERPGTPATAASPSVTLGEIVVRNGALTWRDAAITPAARLGITAIEVRVEGAAWPLAGHVEVRGGLHPPGGGHLRVDARIGVERLDADLRIRLTNAALAPYQPYLPTAARLGGSADADLAVTTPSLREARMRAHGAATVYRLDVRDGQRTIVRTERARVSGLDVEWPARVHAAHVALTRPWLLLERDDTGALALRNLARRRPPRAPAAPATADARPTDRANEPTQDDRLPEIRIARLRIDDGGLRVVDRAVRPAFAVDLDQAAIRVDGLATGEAPAARLDVSARVAQTADLALRGTIGPIDRPLRLDVEGELREFGVPRMNSYLVRQVGWSSRAGEITTALRARIAGDALAASTDIRITRLQLVRASEHDEAQHRVGLPLGLITALMKNRRGDIALAFPIGGRLSDPRFDIREALWGAVRTVAINAITLPVSWIGRMEFSKESKIQRIHVDPLGFEPGTATLTAEGSTQTTRLKRFMDELPDVRLQLTPVVSPGDLTELRRRRVLAAVDELARREELPREQALAKLYEQRLQHRPDGERGGAALAALIEREDLPEKAATDLADRRLDAARAALKQTGIDTERLVATRARAPHGQDGRVALEVIEPEGPRPSRLREALKRLGLPGGSRDASD